MKNEANLAFDIEKFTVNMDGNIIDDVFIVALILLINFYRCTYKTKQVDWSSYGLDMKNSNSLYLTSTNPEEIANINRSKSKWSY